MSQKKISIIGFGSIGKTHFYSFKKLLSSQNIQVISSKDLQIENCSPEIKDVRNFDPDIIAVCTPTSEHINICNFLENDIRDKLILVEKPIFSKVENFTANNNTYLCAYNLRFHPLIQELKKIIENLSISKVEISCLSYLPNWRSGDYSKSYSAMKSKGGGVALDLSHELDLAYNLFGNLNYKESIYEKRSELNIDACDYLSLKSTLENGADCNVTLDFASKKEKRDINILCDDRSIYLDFLSSQMTITENKERKLLKKHHSEISIKDTYDIQANALINEELHDFCTFEDALKVLKLIEMFEK